MCVIALLAAQMGTAAVGGGDSAYATAALREQVHAAAVANRAAPSALNSYRAHLETEMGLIIVDTLGRERTGQLEQLAGTAAWSRAAGYEVHVIGYRSQSVALPVSVLTAVRGWSLPMLYGERLLVGIEDGSATPANAGTKTKGDTLLAVHPFSGDRDRYYTYSGGDTVAVLATAHRRISLVRIRVTPRLEIATRFAAFDGEIDIDASSHDIARMRGRFVVSRMQAQSYSGLSKLIVKATNTVAVAYVEFINAEYDERYWLPATQRIELQATVGLMGGARSVIRIVSHFSAFSIDDTTVDGETPAAYTHRTVTFAPSDSMSAFSAWMSEIGSASTSVGAKDFEDLAPSQWNRDGPSRLTFYPSRPERVVHYNRIEGLFTGAEASLEMRGLSPGVLTRAHAGWAWTEQTARGGFSISTTRKATTTGLQVDRSLVSTGDLQGGLDDGGSSLGAFLASVEDVDYVDRRDAHISLTQIGGSIDHTLLTAKLGVARDADVRDHVSHGPILRSVFFVPNRHAANGSYGIASVAYEFHPDVSGEFLEPGIGSAIRIDVAKGQLSWVRTEASLAVRSNYGPTALAARVDGGMLLSSSPPPQQLFALGGMRQLGGYKYKEFAGDRMALFRASALYGFPVWRAPHRVRRILIPGLTPAIAAGIDGGWTGISSTAAQRAVLELGDGTVANAVSTATGRVRATAGLGLTFFSNAFHFGIVRSIDQPGPWRWTVGLGRVL